MVIKLSICLMLAIVLEHSTLVQGRLKSKWCFRYRELFSIAGCDKDLRGFWCTMMAMFFNQDNIGNPPCSFFPCINPGDRSKRCSPRRNCPADLIIPLGMCSPGLVCHRIEE